MLLVYIEGKMKPDGHSASWQNNSLARTLARGVATPLGALAPFHLRTDQSGCFTTLKSPILMLTTVQVLYTIHIRVHK